MEPLSTASEEQTEADGRGLRLTGWSPPEWSLFAAPALAIGTVAHLGFSVDGISWAVVQIVLVFVAAYDLTNRRVKNAVTVPVSLVALILRAAFERSAFVEVLVAGLVAFLAFFAIALFLRGGLGMGDVKLAAMLGFLLGENVLQAVFVGAIAGGIVALFVLARSTAGRRATMAYGPYLALGGAIAILLTHPPDLI